jgi:hypothetical protein
MPTIVMTKWPSKVDGSVRAKAMDFLQKLATDDTTLGLHVEPIRNSADPRVRTGRVDLYWRAVMFRLDDGGERHYVIHGVFQHDRAEEIARRITLSVNPVNGFPQITEVASRPEMPVVAPPDVPPPPAERAVPAVPLLVRQGRTADQLVDVLGIPPDVATAALAARGEDELLALAAQHEGWLGLMLLDLATGDSIESITERLEVARPAEQTDDATELDSRVLDSLVCARLPETACGANTIRLHRRSGRAASGHRERRPQGRPGARSCTRNSAAMSARRSAGRSASPVGPAPARPSY